MTDIEQKLQELISKREDRNYEGIHTEDVKEFITDLKQLQAEKPIADISKMETTVANTLLYEAGYNEGLADGKKTDIEAIMESIYSHQGGYCKTIDMPSDIIEEILHRHLTHKEGVSENVVEGKCKIYDEIMNNLKNAEYCWTCGKKKDKLEMGYFTCDSCKIDEEI